jgi:hypothetical protein
MPQQPTWPNKKTPKNWDDLLVISRWLVKL